MKRTCVLSSSSNSIGINKPKPPNPTGKENKSRSTFPGMSRPNNFGIRSEQMQSSNGWNKDEEEVQTQKKYVVPPK